MLSLVHGAAIGLAWTYPVKSINLQTAPSVLWYEQFKSASLSPDGLLADAAAGYGVATSDGGFVACGAGNENEDSTNAESFAVKVSSTGSKLWAWKSGHAGASDAAIGCTQLPNGGDILVVGRYDIGGVIKRSVTKLSLTTGLPVWLATDFGDAAGSFGAWETVDITADGSAVLLSGWKGKPDSVELGYRSGGNTREGKAVVMQIPVSAFGATEPPTSANATWTKEWAAHNAAHAARSLPSGKVAVLLWTDEDPHAFPKSTVSGSAALTMLSASGSELWSPINHGAALQMEGTDLTISKDGTNKIVVTGHGKCPDNNNYCGKAFALSESDGSLAWNTTFGSCGVPNECGMTIVKNECWGLQALNDGSGYVLSCGTGIENCNG